MKTKIAKLRCPICLNEKIEYFWAMRGYNLAKCVSCDMVWDPSPLENLSALYDKTYYINENPKGGYTNYFEGMRINKKTFYERLKRIEKKYGKGKLLDVGCALGDCLLEAKKLGWKNAMGLEVSEYAYKFAIKRGLNVQKGLTGNIDLNKNSFDTITYQDVIEHIADPIKELQLAFNLLKPGGLLFLVTPDVGGFWQRVLGSLWYHYKPGEHIMYFSKKSLTKALQQTGYKNIEVNKTYHVLSIEYALSRLRYYSPWFFGLILNVIKKIGMKDISFRAYSGEIEAWAEK